MHDDSCGSDNGGCQQICEKNEDSYICACYRGFTLDSDEVTCIGRILSFFSKKGNYSKLWGCPAHTA